VRDLICAGSRSTTPCRCPLPRDQIPRRLLLESLAETERHASE
jgi:hypothetical protein